MEQNLNNEWRRVASSIYRKPADSKIFGEVEIDITDLEEFITTKRREGIKITLTHVILLAVARALRDEVPELNTYIRRGKVIQRDTIDAMVSVLMPGSQMSSVRVRNADKLTLAGAAEAMNEEIKQSRAGIENSTMRAKGFISSIPWPLRSWVFRFIKLFTVDWGFSIPSLGMSANSFGSFVVTNIGSIGLESGYPALFPTSNVAFVMVVGGVSKKPWVVDNEIVIRKILTLSSALDHRVVDASHGGKLFRYIRNVVRNPEQLDIPQE